MDINKETFDNIMEKLMEYNIKLEHKYNTFERLLLMNSVASRYNVTMDINNAHNIEVVLDGKEYEINPKWLKEGSSYYIGFVILDKETDKRIFEAREETDYTQYGTHLITNLEEDKIKMIISIISTTLDNKFKITDLLVDENGNKVEQNQKQEKVIEEKIQKTKVKTKKTTSSNIKLKT